MPISTPKAERTPDDAAGEAMILIDDEPFTLDCVIEALKGAFPSWSILGVSSVGELRRPDVADVALVVLKCKDRPMQKDPLARDIREIARYFPQVPVVVLCLCDDETSVAEAISAGARGVVPVSATLRIGVAALHLVMAGGTYYPHAAQAGSRPLTVANGGAVPEVPSGAGEATLQIPNGHGVSFTAREAEVLAALQMGRSNKWIANHLNLSENTIKVHIRHIMRKLHATNRTEAVILSRGLPAVKGG